MINWFPGHMNKTLKQMQSDSKLCDCFVYVVDARCPMSSINPEFVKVVGSKPIVFVINKADLVEKSDIERFSAHFRAEGHECISINATQTGSAGVIVKAIKRIFAERLESNRQKGVNFILRAMVLGVPNSGKSTIVNNLCKKTRAVTGNKAGVTRTKQWVKVDGNIEFMDTPGVLLPNFDEEYKAYNLAFVGSVRDDVLNIPAIASKLIEKLLEIDSNVLVTKYGVDVSNYAHHIEILERVGKKRGCVVRGGEIDTERAGKLLLIDFRAGKLGKICLE